jgi:hypothetical protein
MGAKHVLGVVLVGAVMAVSMPAAAFALGGPGGTEHFKLVISSQTGPGAVFASGAFTAGGTDYQGKKVDEAVFADGSFRIDHGRIHTTFSFDPKTCTGKVSGSGPYRLLGGFGAYAGIKGSGTANVKGAVATGRNPNGTCNFRDTTAYSLIVHASGPVSFR